MNLITIALFALLVVGFLAVVRMMFLKVPKTTEIKIPVCPEDGGVVYRTILDGVKGVQWVCCICNNMVEPEIMIVEAWDDNGAAEEKEGS
jgi:hypothetical protein